MTGASVKMDVRKTIARIVQAYTGEPAEEAGFVADDIMQALRLANEIAVDAAPRTIGRGQHIWPCALFYTGNWDDDRPRAACTCEHQHAIEAAS